MSRIIPPLAPDISRWAENMRRYLAKALDQLGFKDASASAAENGVLLWDNTNGYPVVSKDGVWRQIVLADGYAFLGQDNDVTAAAINTAYAVTYDTPAMASGISLGTPASRIVFAEGGTYLLAFSAQIRSTSASTVDFYFWPRINGTNVAGSTIKASLHNNGATTVVSRSAIFQMNAGDYLEVMWAVDDIVGHLRAVPATAFAPATPSTSLSITRIRA